MAKFAKFTEYKPSMAVEFRVVGPVFINPDQVSAVRACRYHEGVTEIFIGSNSEPITVWLSAAWAVKRLQGAAKDE